MGSWVRDAPFYPPKKSAEFVRLPKDLPNQANVIEEVLPYPAPSRLFTPGSGQRMVDESTVSRSGVPAFSPISEAATRNDQSDVKKFEVMSTVNVKKKERKFLPRNPEPFVPLSKQGSASTAASGNNKVAVEGVAGIVDRTTVKTFENPSKISLNTHRKLPTNQIVRQEPKNRNIGVVAGTTESHRKKNVAQMEAAADPQITIAIPLFNGIEFLEEALQSIKRQTYQAWTGIIGVNGFGNTGEPAFTKASDMVYNLGLAKRFIVVNYPDVKGAANAINNMVGQAATPYIAHIDADDLWLSKKLEYQMSVFEQDPEIGIVGTMCRYFGDSNEAKILPPGNLTVDDFTKFNPLIHSSILMKREICVYSDEFVAYDFCAWCRNVKNGVKIYNINNILVLHRIHSKSFYNTSGKQAIDGIIEKYGLLKGADNSQTKSISIPAN